MKILTYFKRLGDAARKIRKKHQPVTGKMSGLTVEESEPSSTLSVQKAPGKFGNQQAQELQSKKLETRNQIQMIQGQMPVQKFTASTFRIIRALRFLVGSIRAAFRMYFIPTPVNNALSHQLNKLDQLLEKGQAIDVRKLERTCCDLKGITERKDLHESLRPLVNSIYQLSNCLTEACARGDQVVTIPVATGSMPDGSSDPKVISGQELSELLSDADHNAAVIALEEHGQHEYSRPTELSQLIIAKALHINDPDEAPTLNSLINKLDLTSILKLQQQYPEACNGAEEIQKKVLKKLSDTLAENDPEGSAMNIDVDALKQVVSSGLDSLTDLDLQDTCREAFRLAIIFRSIDHPASESLLNLYEQVKKSCLERGSISNFELNLSNVQWLHFTGGGRKNVSALVSIVPEEELAEVLRQDALILKNLLEKAIDQDYKAFIHWLSRHSVSLERVEEKYEPIFQRYDRNRFTPEEVQLLLDLGVTMMVPGTFKPEYSQESDSFPYDHQIILTDSGLISSGGSKALYRKNGKHSSLYLWDPESNTLELRQGKQHLFTGNYKIVIRAHGTPLDVGINGQCYYASDIAEKLETLIRTNGGKSPAKITLESCMTAARIPFYGCFAERLTKELHKKGISTQVSAYVGTVETDSKSGRKTICTDPKDSLPFAIFRIRKKVQTKSQKDREYYEKQGFEPASDLKRVFWVEQGKVRSRVARSINKPSSD